MDAREGPASDQPTISQPDLGTRLYRFLSREGPNAGTSGWLEGGGVGSGSNRVWVDWAAEAERAVRGEKRCPRTEVVGSAKVGRGRGAGTLGGSVCCRSVYHAAGRKKETDC